MEVIDLQKHMSTSKIADENITLDESVMIDTQKTTIISKYAVCDSSAIRGKKGNTLTCHKCN